MAIRKRKNRGTCRSEVMRDGTPRGQHEHEHETRHGPGSRRASIDGEGYGVGSEQVRVPAPPHTNGAAQLAVLPLTQQG